MMVGIVEVDVLQLINSARLAGQGASGIQLPVLELPTDPATLAHTWMLGLELRASCLH